MPPLPLAPSRGRFLHLVPDDKYIDAARGVFEEVLPGAHDYLLIGNVPLRYLRSFEPVRFEVDEVLKPDFLASLAAYSVVFVHFLTDQARLFVATAPSSIRFVWLGWGADFYHLIYPRDELYLPRTLSLLKDPALRGNALRDKWARLSRRLRMLARPSRLPRLFAAQHKLQGIGRGAPDEMALLNRFSAMATPIIEDFESIRARNPEFRVPFLDWNYRVEGFDEHGGPDSPTGSDILLGNSATPENNHLDALHILSQCLPAGRRIICPLSYGNKAYGDVVAREGKALFGDRFVALREYMPSAEYSKIIEGCSVVAMNHIRQQALGNIVVALCSGAHVFLNPKSPIIRAMRRIGINVDTMDVLPGFLSKTERIVLKPELQATRDAIAMHFGHDSILRRTRAMLDELR